VLTLYYIEFIMGCHLDISLQGCASIQQQSVGSVTSSGFTVRAISYLTRTYSREDLPHILFAASSRYPSTACHSHGLFTDAPDLQANQWVLGILQ
jgi:hypothetical protein